MECVRLTETTAGAAAGSRECDAERLGLIHRPGKIQKLSHESLKSVLSRESRRSTHSVRFLPCAARHRPASPASSRSRTALTRRGPRLPRRGIVGLRHLARLAPPRADMRTREAPHVLAVAAPRSPCRMVSQRASLAARGAQDHEKIRTREAMSVLRRKKSAALSRCSTLGRQQAARGHVADGQHADDSDSLDAKALPRCRAARSGICCMQSRPSSQASTCKASDSAKVHSPPRLTRRPDSLAAVRLKPP